MDIHAKPSTGRQVISHIRDRIKALRVTDPKLADTWMVIRDSLLDAAADGSVDLALPVGVEDNTVTGTTRWVNLGGTP